MEELQEAAKMNLEQTRRQLTDEKDRELYDQKSKFDQEMARLRKEMDKLRMDAQKSS